MLQREKCFKSCESRNDSRFILSCFRRSFFFSSQDNFLLSFFQFTAHIYPHVISFYFSFPAEESCLLLFLACFEQLRLLKATNFIFLVEARAEKDEACWNNSFYPRTNELCTVLVFLSARSHITEAWVVKVVIKTKAKLLRRKTRQSWIHEKWIAIIARNIN